MLCGLIKWVKGYRKSCLAGIPFISTKRSASISVQSLVCCTDSKLKYQTDSGSDQHWVSTIRFTDATVACLHMKLSNKQKQVVGEDPPILQLGYDILFNRGQTNRMFNSRSSPPYWLSMRTQSGTVQDPSDHSHPLIGYSDVRSQIYWQSQLRRVTALIAQSSISCPLKHAAGSANGTIKIIDTTVAVNNGWD